MSVWGTILQLIKGGWPPAADGHFLAVTISVNLIATKAALEEPTQTPSPLPNM